MRLGAQANLVGILTLPVAARSAQSERPTVLVLNAGVLHRVGPHRLHVNLARRLAALGFAVLRVDLAGIGDSLAVTGARSFRESAVADTRAAMDDLAAQVGAQRFVIFGLCSGADNALATAAQDPRVVGIVVLDPPTYATRRALARKVVRRATRLGPRRTVDWAIATVRRVVRDRNAEPEPEEGRETPPLAVYREQVGGLLARGVKVLAIYSGALGERYNDVDQLFEYAPELRGKLDHAFFSRANHMFTERDQQTELIDTVAAWIDRTFR